MLIFRPAALSGANEIRRSREIPVARWQDQIQTARWPITRSVPVRIGHSFTQKGASVPLAAV